MDPARNPRTRSRQAGRRETLIRHPEIRLPVLFVSLLQSSPSSEAWPAEIAWAVRGHDVETHVVRPNIGLDRLERRGHRGPQPEDSGHPEAIRLLEDEASSLLREAQAAELQRDRVRHRAGPNAEAMLWLLDDITARVEARLAAARS